MSKEFEKIVLQKFDELDKKIDEKVGALDKKIDEKVGALDKKIDEKVGVLDKKIDKKVGTLDEKIVNLSTKLDYTNNNVAKILEEQIKMREEMKKYNEQNEKEHRLFEYEINNLKRYVV